MSHNNTVKGYSAYKVANDVKHHYAIGLGVYDVFINTNGAEIFLDNAIEVPNADDVLIENACIVEIANGSGPKVGINRIINGTGCGITTGETSQTVSGKRVVMLSRDYYTTVTKHQYHYLIAMTIQRTEEMERMHIQQIQVLV